MTTMDSWLYYVPLLLNDEGRVSFSAKMVETDGALNSAVKVLDMIDTLTAEFIEGEPEPGTMPVIPLGWTLITAKRGAGVKAPKAKKRGNGRPSP